MNPEKKSFIILVVNLRKTFVKLKRIGKEKNSNKLPFFSKNNNSFLKMAIPYLRGSNILFSSKLDLLLSESEKKSLIISQTSYLNILKFREKKMEIFFNQGRHFHQGKNIGILENELLSFWNLGFETNLNKNVWDLIEFEELSKVSLESIQMGSSFVEISKQEKSSQKLFDLAREKIRAQIKTFNSQLEVLGSLYWTRKKVIQLGFQVRRFSFLFCQVLFFLFALDFVINFFLEKLERLQLSLAQNTKTLLVVLKFLTLQDSQALVLADKFEQDFDFLLWEEKLKNFHL